MYSFVLTSIYSREMGCLMGFRFVLKKSSTAAIGIGAMVIFIGMVLVAGIAASVIIQTANTLETTGMESGSQTTAEVATGIRVCDIEGQKATAWRFRNVSGSGNSYWANNTVTNLTITVSPRAGSPPVDLSQIVIEISNSDVKSILTYNTGEPEFVSSVPSNGIFSSTDGANNIFEQESTTFGIIELEDADNSCGADTPVINRGDMVMICINASACFNGCSARTDIWGTIIPEGGSISMFSFRVPGLGSDTVFDLY